MSSIRPLATIAILTIAGVFLYSKLNEPPTDYLKGPDGPEQTQAAQGVAPAWIPPATVEQKPVSSPATSAHPAPTKPPAINTDDRYSLYTSSAPPAQPITPPTVSPPKVDTAATMPPANTTTLTPPVAAPTVTTSVATPVSTPTVPELPPIPKMAASPPEDNRYGDFATSSNSPDATPRVAETARDVFEPERKAEAANLTAAESTPDGLGTQVMPYSAESSVPINPLRPHKPAPPQTISQETPTQSPTPSEPIATKSPYSMAKPAIQAALDRGELSRAHLLLSQWYDEPTLTTAERQEIEAMLSQLAGTVVYSNEHRLEPPYVVSAGETLETIAVKYEVPWQLLAKINGVTRPDQIEPGQKVKVIRGPFSAVVDMSDRQMTLMVEGRYAGRFPVNLAPTTPVVEGEWVVERKDGAPPMASATSVITDSQSPAPLRSLILKGAETATATASLTLGSADAAAANSQSSIQVSAADAEDLVDILSVGSRVVVRR